MKREIKNKIKHFIVDLQSVKDEYPYDSVIYKKAKELEKQLDELYDLITLP